MTFGDIKDIITKPVIHFAKAVVHYEFTAAPRLGSDNLITGAQIIVGRHVHAGRNASIQRPLVIGKYTIQDARWKGDVVHVEAEYLFVDIFLESGFYLSNFTDREVSAMIQAHLKRNAGAFERQCPGAILLLKNLQTASFIRRPKLSEHEKFLKTGLELLLAQEDADPFLEEAA
jgi:hypothetical protein